MSKQAVTVEELSIRLGEHFDKLNHAVQERDSRAVDAAWSVHCNLLAHLNRTDFFMVILFIAAVVRSVPWWGVVFAAAAVLLAPPVFRSRAWEASNRLRKQDVESFSELPGWRP